MMSRNVAISLGLAMLLLAAQPCSALAQNTGTDRKAQSKALAETIDKVIHARLQAARIKPGPKAEISQLVRRLHIDLTGKIPTVEQLMPLIHETKDLQTKLEERIDNLLADETYAFNFTNFWRPVMLHGADTYSLMYEQVSFEGWLRTQLTANVSYANIARELIAPVVPKKEPPQGQPSPLGFYRVNGNREENLARATARVFMGVKMECAQCHSHPFASWTRTQFWELAAFFTKDNKGEIKIPTSDKVVKAKFLTGDEPKIEPKGSPKATLANWLTTRDNPYFARAAVDHLWNYFFGISLVDPILEPKADSPPVHPQLLDEMAKAFAANDFDLKFLIRSIVLSDAYQRASVAQSDASKLELQMFAKIPVRSMLPEQLYDCVCVATGMSDSDPASSMQILRLPKGKAHKSPRTKFLSMFSKQENRVETQTSMLQSLYMMNGPFVRSRSEEVGAHIVEQNMATQRQVEALYLQILSRMPRPEEMQRMTRFIEDGGADRNPRQAIADICWILLNSSEFLLNH